MTLAQMQYYKQQKGYSYARLSELSGVPLGTIQKIFRGETKNPRSETLEALEKALMPEMKPDVLCETTAYQTFRLPEDKGTYTLEDYYRLPEERRVELIDGCFYDMSAPGTIHQTVALDLCFQLKDFIRQNRGDCVPFIAPVDVQLNCDDMTMVEPDVLLVCDKSKITRRCIMGAPDFIIEVVSESTKRKDAIVKLKKYRDAGVREYWMVDAGKKRVVVYFFEEDELPVIYGFSDVIPVGVFGGRLKMDFSRIMEQISTEL